jgi:hypothetical protein
MSVKRTKVFSNGGVVVWQTAEEDGAPELPVLVHVDASGLIVLSQEGRDVIVSPRTVADLCGALKAAADREKSKV